ncbi:uncharacterized protein LOC124539790 [Vanessa cardui]|uniref:uncharacterized protein LOC124539790 n=1 Tax=Vanessa cardui TaxID=171605 RepID=UPI001F137A76|nr:uncharacterized protein LOC124539790 [Vanessa cardui]
MKVCLILVTVSLTWIPQPGTTNRKKRSNTDNFNILLSIYKMNPLQRSKVFKTFSNRILLPKPDEQTPELNYNSNESTKKQNGTKVKLKPIEEYIHDVPDTPVIDRPLYIENKPESFNPGQFLDTLISRNNGNSEMDNDDAENLIKRVDHPNKKLNSLHLNILRNTTDYTEDTPARFGNLKVFNLNKVDNNEFDFDNADVVVVK